MARRHRDCSSEAVRRAAARAAMRAALRCWLRPLQRRSSRRQPRDRSSQLDQRSSSNRSSSRSGHRAIARTIKVHRQCQEPHQRRPLVLSRSSHLKRPSPRRRSSANSSHSQAAAAKAQVASFDTTRGQLPRHQCCGRKAHPLRASRPRRDSRRRLRPLSRPRLPRALRP